MKARDLLVYNQNLAPYLKRVVKKYLQWWTFQHHLWLRKQLLLSSHLWCVAAPAALAASAELSQRAAIPFLPSQLFVKKLYHNWLHIPKDFHAARPSMSRIIAVSWLWISGHCPSFAVNYDTCRWLCRRDAAASVGKNAKISGFWRNFLRTFWREKQRQNRKANIKMAKGKSSSLAKQIAELEVKAPTGMKCNLFIIIQLKTNAI